VEVHTYAINTIMEVYKKEFELKWQIYELVSVIHINHMNPRYPVCQIRNTFTKTCTGGPVKSYLVSSLHTRTEEEKVSDFLKQIHALNVSGTGVSLLVAPPYVPFEGEGEGGCFTRRSLH